MTYESYECIAMCHVLIAIHFPVTFTFISTAVPKMCLMYRYGSVSS